MSPSVKHPVVVGVAGTGEGDPALTWAARVAASLRTDLVVVHAADPESIAARMAGAEVVAVTAVLEAENEMLRGLRERLAELGPELGIETTIQAGRGSAVAALLDHQDDAALIVVGTGRKGAVEEFVLGSTSLGVAAHARCPVAVVNPGVDVDSLTHGRVGVAVDGSPDSARAARVALALARRTGSAVTAMSTWYLEVMDGYVVTDPGSPEWERIEQQRAAAMDRALEGAVESYPEVEVERVVRRGPVVPTLREAAQGWDALVMGSRGLGGIQGRLLGSVSQRLMRSSPCPVIVTRAR